MRHVGCWRRVVVLAAQDFFAVVQGWLVKGDPGFCSSGSMRTGLGELSALRRENQDATGIRTIFRRVAKVIILQKRQAEIHDVGGIQYLLLALTGRRCLRSLCGPALCCRCMAAGTSVPDSAAMLVDMGRLGTARALLQKRAGSCDVTLPLPCRLAAPSWQLSQSLPETQVVKPTTIPPQEFQSGPSFKCCLSAPPCYVVPDYIDRSTGSAASIPPPSSRASHCRPISSSKPYPANPHRPF